MWPEKKPELHKDCYIDMWCHTCNESVEYGLYHGGFNEALSLCRKHVEDIIPSIEEIEEIIRKDNFGEYSEEYAVGLLDKRSIHVKPLAEAIHQLILEKLEIKK